MEDGQVDGDPARQSQSSYSKAAWDAVQLETGRKSMTPQDEEVDPTKGRDVNVVVWFGLNDPEVSKERLLGYRSLIASLMLRNRILPTGHKPNVDLSACRSFF